MNEVLPWKISTLHSKGNVCGKNTEICVTEFRDKFLVIITDSGKIGSLVKVDYHVTEFKSPENESYEAKVIFGRDEPEIQAIALTLAENYFHKSMILGLSMKKFDQDIVKDIKNLVESTVQKKNEQ